MGWSIGYDTKWKRDIGYGVPAICDHPGCFVAIDRGLAYVCAGSEPYGGDDGCGLFFCDKHSSPGRHLCERCCCFEAPFPPKPDTVEWINWKETEESWAPWRAERAAKRQEAKIEREVSAFGQWLAVTAETKGCTKERQPIVKLFAENEAAGPFITQWGPLILLVFTTLVISLFLGK